MRERGIGLTDGVRSAHRFPLPTCRSCHKNKPENVAFMYVTFASQDVHSTALINASQVPSSTFCRIDAFELSRTLIVLHAVKLKRTKAISRTARLCIHDHSTLKGFARCLLRICDTGLMRVCLCLRGREKKKKKTTHMPQPCYPGRSQPPTHRLEKSKGVALFKKHGKDSRHNI